MFAAELKTTDSKTTRGRVNWFYSVQLTFSITVICIWEKSSSSMTFNYSPSVFIVIHRCCTCIRTINLHMQYETTEAQFTIGAATVGVRTPSQFWTVYNIYTVSQKNWATFLRRITLQIFNNLYQIWYKSKSLHSEHRARVYLNQLWKIVAPSSEWRWHFYNYKFWIGDHLISYIISANLFALLFHFFY